MYASDVCQYYRFINAVKEDKLIWKSAFGCCARFKYRFQKNVL